MDDFGILRARHIEDVRAFTPEAIARLSWSRERVREEQGRRLRRVLAHAQANPPAFQLGDLEALPSMTKDDVMDAWDEVVTDSELHLQDVVSHLDGLLSGEKTNAYLRGKYYAAATGGSSGKRGIFLWDWETFVVTANITYRMEARRDLQEPPSGARRTADLRGIIRAWEQVSTNNVGLCAGGAGFSCRPSHPRACRRAQRIPA